MPTWRVRRVTLLRELTRAAVAAYVEMIERREREERGERRETHRALCRAKTAKCGRDPDRADLRPLTII